MPTQSRRFWILICGSVLGVAAIIATAIRPEAQPAIETVLPMVLGLLGVGVYSDGQRPMGDRPGTTPAEDKE
tara:strand:+ start:3293 stop:3508 length:216 start_codon:yes stop_codon:yes gene_type:complete